MFDGQPMQFTEYRSDVVVMFGQVIKWPQNFECFGVYLVLGYGGLPRLSYSSQGRKK